LTYHPKRLPNNCNLYGDSPPTENATDEEDDMTQMLSTKEVAKFLGINEKMVYTLISEKGLPASKVTGKWIFPRHLVEQWVESSTVNYPQNHNVLPPYEGLLIIAGSNDILLEKALSLFNGRHSKAPGGIRKPGLRGRH
jgi:excisionase family DNA binding protein